MRCCWSMNSAPPATSATIIRTRLCQSSTSALTLALDWLVEFKRNGVWDKYLSLFDECRKWVVTRCRYMTCPRHCIDPRTSPLLQTASRAPAPSALRVTRIRALRGPNFWRLAPVIACDVRLGALEALTSVDVPGFCDRLVAALLSLHEHPCSRGTAGGFVDRLGEGTDWPHILEHVGLELQTPAGSDVSFGRVVPSGDEASGG